MDLTPTPNDTGTFNDVGGYKLYYSKEGVLDGKTYLESMSYEIGFGADTEMGGFALDKGPEVSLAPEPFWTSIFTSSVSVVEAAK